MGHRAGLHVLPERPRSLAGRPNLPTQIRDASRPWLGEEMGPIATGLVLFGLGSVRGALFAANAALDGFDRALDVLGVR